MKQYGLVGILFNKKFILYINRSIKKATRYTVYPVWYTIFMGRISHQSNLISSDDFVGQKCPLIDYKIVSKSVSESESV